MNTKEGWNKSPLYFRRHYFVRKAKEKLQNLKEKGKIEF